MNLNSSLQKNPIAVIGLSSIFADAKNVEEFWTNIIQSKDSIKDVPANRWLIEDYFDEDMTAEDKTYCKRGGFLPEIDFNPMEFGLPPNILEVTDASQLLGLIAARDAFEDAGYGRESAKFSKELKEKTGVLLGVGGGQKLITPLIARLQFPIWERALRSSGISEDDIPRIVEKMKKAYVGWNENSFPGLLGNVISGRITNRFDLGGINSVVDAACAASLSAIKMALSELIEKRCDMMLTGGVDTDNSPFMYMSFSKTPAFSKSGNISPFSEKADGMLIGEGIGMLVLKRLEDAERDGDQVYAVITGVGTSSDGRFKSVYAPRPAGQALAMNRAYEDAGYKPSTVGLLEGHGTGTGAGDPTEFTSMQMVFGADNPQKQHIALGSVKSQIGHTKASAGAAGIIKATLALHHKILPPTINVEEPNKKFNIEDSPIYINTEARPWIKNGHPRRAGVSAFGFGGINVHLTLEEYSGKKQDKYRLHQPYKSVLLQASTLAELKAICEATISELKLEEGETTFFELNNKSNTLELNANWPRLGFVATSIEECIGHLEIALSNFSSKTDSWEHPKGIYFNPKGINTQEEKVAALFAGQGAQYTGMGREFVNAFPEALATMQLADQLYTSEQKAPLSKSIYPIPTFTQADKDKQQHNLTQTQFAQPAIAALSMAQFNVLKKAGLKPQFTAGHSFGELTALWAAGCFDETAFLSLAKARGEAMVQTDSSIDSGAMLAVKASREEVEAAISFSTELNLANVNSQKQVVLGGSTQAIKNAENTLAAKGFSVVPLPVSAAFHTQYVGHAKEKFATSVNSKSFSTPTIPVFANSTGLPYSENTAVLKSTLINQILNPVLFKDQIENIYNSGARVFIEFGPKGILTNLVKTILKDKAHTAIAINQNAKKDSDLQFRQAAIQLRVLGISLSNIDPYKKELSPLPPKSMLTLKISGNNHVSQPTQKAFTDVMSNGFKVKSAAAKTVVETKVVEKIITVEKIVEVPSSNGINTLSNKADEEMMNRETLQLLQTTLESFKNNQSKSLEIFERFMQEQNKQSQQLLNLLSTQIGNQTTAASSDDLMTHSNGNGNGNGAGNGMDLTSSTIGAAKVHSNGSNGVKTAIAQQTAQQTAQKPVQKAIQESASISSNPTSSLDLGKLTASLLEVVSEKTGYPAEMLELNMDMEADLGIDSIKRVEIFGALTQQCPEVSGINPNELAELRTLQEIVDFVQAENGVSSNSNITASATSTASATANNSSSLNLSKLTQNLLEVVSEKTGYPSEMLELSMDMEADLGIDSIKRVEIFGALTQQFPEMSGIDPNELTELRTLQEIVDHVSAKSGSASTSPSNNSVVETTEITPITPLPTSAGLNTVELERILLKVVGEKTGYPEEMLELSMDMEADLGIDSIKRVEIFGALTQGYPEMDGIDPNELTELRTLGEIVDHVSDHAKKKVQA